MVQQFKRVKIRVTVPADAAKKIRQILGKAGAGKIGNYIHCSTSFPVTGRFLPQIGASPTIGKIGEPETVEEEMIEMICESSNLKKVISALKQAHPYEQPVIDIIPLMNLDL